MSGVALLLVLLLSSLVVTGATGGIGRAYAHEVSPGAEPCGWWGLLSVCMWSDTPVGLRILYFGSLGRPLLQRAFPLLLSLGHVFTLGFYCLLASPHHRPDSFIESILMDLPIL